MMYRKKIALILLFAGMVICCVLFAGIDARNASFCLGTFDRLAVRLRTNAYEETIQIFQRERDDTWYFFLPSGMDDRVIRNDTPVTSLVIDGTPLAPFASFKWEEDRAYRFAYENIHGPQEITVKFVTTSELPAVFIRTESGNTGALDTDKDHIEAGSITVYEANGAVSLHGGLTVTGRGNSTYYTFAKKAYNIKLDKAGWLLGMEKAKDWCLLANAWDYSYMNNKLAYDMAEKAGFSFVPDSRYADLYFNGDYRGLFLITEKVEVGKNRLNITDLEELNKRANPGADPTLAETFEEKNKKGVLLENVPADLSGGYLLERDYRIEPDYIRPKIVSSSFKTEDFGTPIRIRSPKYADRREVEYISNLVNEMEQAIRSEDGLSASGKSWLDYIDLESWVRWYVVAEITYESDKGSTSTFLYKDRDAADPKIHMGPVWDFDNAFGGNIEYMSPQVLSKTSEDGWVQFLYDRPKFLAAVRDEWKRFFRDYLAEEAPARLEEWEKLIRKSVELDNLRWWRGEGYEKYWPLTGGGIGSAYLFDRETEHLRWWLAERRQFLDSVWGGD